MGLLDVLSGMQNGPAVSHSLRLLVAADKMPGA
jgi:hypothetical protein